MVNPKVPRKTQKPKTRHQHRVNNHPNNPVQMELPCIRIVFNFPYRFHLNPAVETLYDEEQVELAVVVFSDAVPNPETMMVIFLDTSLTFATVSGAVLTNFLAELTKMA